MDFQQIAKKLVKHDEFKSDYDMQEDVRWGLAELFGIPRNPFKRIFERKTKSRYYALDEIADVLLKNNLIEDEKDIIGKAEAFVTDDN